MTYFIPPRWGNLFSIGMLKGDKLLKGFAAGVPGISFCFAGQILFTH